MESVVLLYSLNFDPGHPVGDQQLALSESEHNQLFRKSLVYIWHLFLFNDMQSNSSRPKMSKVQEKSIVTVPTQKCMYNWCLFLFNVQLHAE